MNKKRLVVASIILVLLIAGGVFLYVFVTYHTVSIVNPNKISVSLYDAADKDKKSIIKTDLSTTVSLKNGEYCTVTSDTDYDTSPSCFSVNGKNTSVTINPNYSDTRLSTMLPSEANAIDTVINNKYAAIINQYTIGTGKLYAQGQWYGTTLTQNVTPSERPDIYRLLLRKTNGEWSVVVYPQISVSKYDYPDVPYDILQDLNKQSGYDPGTFVNTDTKSSYDDSFSYPSE